MSNKKRIEQLEAQLSIAMNICRKLIGVDTSDAVAKEFDDLEQEVYRESIVTNTEEYFPKDIINI